MQINATVTALSMNTNTRQAAGSQPARLVGSLLLLGRRELLPRLPRLCSGEGRPRELAGGEVPRRRHAWPELEMASVRSGINTERVPTKLIAHSSLL